MKTKKTVIAVITAALVISALLIASCISPLEEVLEGKIFKQDAQDGEYQSSDSESDNQSADNQGGGYKIPKGMGAIRINLTGKNARTIMPDSTSFEIEDMFFEVRFTNVDTPTDIVWFPHGASETVQSATKLDYDNFNEIPVSLTNGETYDILITAYNNVNGSIPIAGWNNTLYEAYEDGVEVGPGTVTVNANLYPLIDDDYDGSFDYYIEIPDISTCFPSTSFTVTTAPASWTAFTLDILNYGGSSLGGPTYPINLLTGGNDNGTNIPIPSGYYILKLTLSADDCQTRVIEEVMHIYPAMKTVYGTSSSKKTIYIPNQNTFTVRFNSSNGTISDPSFGTSGVEDKYPIANGAKAAPTSPPSLAAYNLDGWSTTQGGSTMFDIAARNIFRDMTLYAKWSAKTSIALNMTFTFADQATITPDAGNPATIAYDNFDGGGTGGGTITFTLADASDFNNIKWKLEGYTLYDSANGNAELEGDSIVIDENTIVSNDNLTTNKPFSSLLSEGNIYLTVMADTVASPVTSYSAETTIVVYNP